MPCVPAIEYISELIRDYYFTCTYTIKSAQCMPLHDTFDPPFDLGGHSVTL